jgi:hypothetical protein
MREYIPAKMRSKFPEDLRLRLHMGIGVGTLTSVHVGGVFKVGLPVAVTGCICFARLAEARCTVQRWEYIIGGPPMEQIGNAEPLANPGETCISPETHAMIKGEIEVGAGEKRAVLGHKGMSQRNPLVAPLSCRPSFCPNGLVVHTSRRAQGSRA